MFDLGGGDKMAFKKLRKWSAICLATALLLSGCASTPKETTTQNTGDDTAHEASATEGSQKESQEDYTIGVMQIVEHPALDAAREGFIEALDEAGFKGNVVFDNKNAQGDMPTAQIIAQSFVDNKVDMIYAIATPTAQAAVNATSDIPIIISAVTDPVAAGLVQSFETPGTNVSGTCDEAPIDLQLQLIDQLGIKGTTIGFIYNTSEKNSEIQLEMIKVEAEKLGMNVVASGITSITEMEQALDVLLDKVDILYTPTDNMVTSAKELVVNKALNKNVPLLAAEPGMVEAGGLVTCGVDYYVLGKQSGAIAAKVLNGVDISTIPVEKATNPEVTINLSTAKTLGIEINDDFIENSNVVGEK